MIEYNRAYVEAMERQKLELDAELERRMAGTSEKHKQYIRDLLKPESIQRYLD